MKEARDIRAYCDAVHQSHLDLADETKKWITWVRAYADRIDPTTIPPRPPPALPPTPEELQPYLAGWSPHQPTPRNR